MSLLARYILDDGNFTKDYSGNTTGTLGGSVTLSKIKAPGFETCAHFSNGYIQIGRKAMNTKSITVSAWGYMDNWGSYPNKRIISCTEGGGWDFFAYQSKMSFECYISGIGYKYALDDTALNSLSKGWHYFVGTFDNGTLKFYRDGQLKQSINTGGNSIAYHGSNSIFIGAEAGGSSSSPAGEYFSGELSDIRIYSEALSSSQIKYMYENPSPITIKSNKKIISSGEFVEGYNYNNIVASANNNIYIKKWGDGLSKYEQPKCTCSLTDKGYRIYRPANLIHNSSTEHNMWGGFILYNDNNRFNLKEEHSYVFLLDVNGKTTNGATDFYWSNSAGWGGGGLTPKPIELEMHKLPSNFNSTTNKTYFYAWKIPAGDKIFKVCTESYSSFKKGTTYTSYRDLKFGFTYSNTGSMGTDIYITNIRLYDITNKKSPILLTKDGNIKCSEISEFKEPEFNKYGNIYCNEFIEG